MTKFQEFSPGVGQYINEIHKNKPLSREEEAELARRIKLGDSKAREKLIKANTRFVGKIATEYLGHGLPMADLISAGNVGLVMAAGRFDESRNVKFVSYAVWWIRQAILEAITESRMVRVPINKIKSIIRLSRVRRSLAHCLGRPPDYEELALQVGWTVQEVDEISCLSVWEFSLDTPSPRGESTFMDLLPDQSAGPDDVVAEKMLWEEVETVLEHLDERGRKVLALYFGLGGGEPITLQKIADRIGLTKERVRQIRDGAILDLKLAILRNRNSKTKPWLKAAEAPI